MTAGSASTGLRESLADALVRQLPGAQARTEFGDPVAVVPADRWLAAASLCRDALGLTYLDMLTAVDEGAPVAGGPGADEAGAFVVVAYLWSPVARAGLLLRTAVPAAAPTLASITPVFAGADWHERETAEMFGIAFAGHPNPVPLLLPDPPPPGLHQPLRKAHPLQRRADTTWPGAVDPADSGEPA